MRIYLCLFACLAVAGLVSSCAMKKEVVSTQSDLATVKGNLQGLDSSLSQRLAGLSEEILEQNRSLAALKARDDEFRQAFSQLQQKINVNKIETDENLRHLTELNREYQKTLEANIQNLSKTLEARTKDLEVKLSDLRHQMDEVNALENDQNRRIGETVNRLNIFLDEINAESARLQKGLVELSQGYNQMAEKMNALNKELAVVKERLKAAGARSHVIVEGETLSSVAAKYDLSVDDLVRINGLANPNSIKVGQRILLTAP